MQAPHGDPPRGAPLSRRAALGGLVAAAAVPAALAELLGDARPAAAQSLPVPLLPSRPALPRQNAIATALADGRLLVAGGYLFSPLASVQIYDPVQGVWREAAPMRTPRHQHAAALLPDGRVLVCGGIHVGPLATAEIYDPGANAWTPIERMPLPRCGHSAAVTGQGVLVTGGCYLQALTAPALFDGATWRLL
jgi:hypothetical protein